MGKKPQRFERYCLPCVISIFDAICLLSFNYNQPSLSSKHSGQKLSTFHVYLIFYFTNSVESTLHLKGRHGGVKIYRNSENYIRISSLI